ncbi:MAG: hypothetical protein O7F17_11540, partial [Planctomycetota bacterium]|nr:hypothetical protein [Planctomycetota bacterium]
MYRQMLGVLACFGVCPWLSADDFCGAEGVIQQVCVVLPDAAGLAGQEKPKTPLDEFRDKVKAFGGVISAVPLDEAVTRWLDLVDEYNHLLDDPRSRTGSGGYVGSWGSYDRPRSGFDLMITALPPPASWPLLAEAIQARPIGDDQQALREHCLRLLATLLLADEEAQCRELEAIDKFVTKFSDSWQQQTIAQRLQSLTDALAALSDNPLLEVESFVRRLEYLEQIRDPNDLGIMSMTGLVTPDLVTVVGQEKAESLLRRALIMPVMLEATKGEETQRLARRLAVQLIDQLRKPQWKLCYSMTAAALYEALDDRFIKQAQTSREEAAAKDPAALVELLNRRRPAMDDHHL